MSGTPLTIVIADDHAVVRQGLRLLLEAEDDLAVVGESSDVQETCAVLREFTPSVVLLDLHMGRELSLSALFEIRGASPDTAIVILTMEDDPAFLAPAWNAGAAGYVLKESSRTDLVRAIRHRRRDRSHRRFRARARVERDQHDPHRCARIHLTRGRDVRDRRGRRPVL